MISIHSIQVGRVRRFDDTEDAKRPWSSGIIKSAVEGPIRLTSTHLEGDEQADLVHHGGHDKAVLVYPSEHYPFWGTEFNAIQWVGGCFGENLTTVGAVESDVCIGDVYQVGDCRLQVSQPRQPCWKLSQRWGLPKLAVRVQQTRRTGWYLRVLCEGTLNPGDEIRLVEQPFPKLTINYANEVMYGHPKTPNEHSKDEPSGANDKASRDRIQRSHDLAACDALAESWKKTLLSR